MKLLEKMPRVYTGNAVKKFGFGSHFSWSLHGFICVLFHTVNVLILF